MERKSRLEITTPIQFRLLHNISTRELLNTGAPGHDCHRQVPTEFGTEQAHLDADNADASNLTEG